MLNAQYLADLLKKASELYGMARRVLLTTTVGGVSGVIPYDRNLYLTVTSPDGQDKEILGAKACYQHSGNLAFLKTFWTDLCPKRISLEPSLGNQKQIDTFVSTPILREINSKVDNIPGRTEGHGEGVHGGVSGAALLSLGLLRGSEVHQLRAKDGGQCQGGGGVHTASGANIWRENRKCQHYF